MFEIEITANIYKWAEYIYWFSVCFSGMLLAIDFVKRIGNDIKYKESHYKTTTNPYRGDVTYYDLLMGIFVSTIPVINTIYWLFWNNWAIKVLNTVTSFLSKSIIR